jgi:hypothetical protein
VEDICRQLWFCGAMPSEWHELTAFLMPVLVIIAVGLPVANVLHRAGRSRWWTILAFVPLLNLLALWVFAFGRWPSVDQQTATRLS